MGASLSVNLTQLGKDDVNRTAVVNVEVIVTSDGGTYNHIGAPFYLTVDGSTISFNATFGSPQSGTFASTLYFGSFNVDYNSNGTKTVVASASFVTGTSAGTISCSGSLTLTPISSSGGDDDDDNTEEGGDDIGGSGSGSATILSPGFEGNVKWLSFVQDGMHCIGTDGFDTYVLELAFETPEFTGESTSIDIAIKADYSEINRGSQTIGIVICSSIDNDALYNNEYQIAATEMTIVNNGYGIVNIPTKELRGSTTYYIILWMPAGYGTGLYYIDSIDNHRVRVNYTEDNGDGGNTGYRYLWVEDEEGMSITIYKYDANEGIYIDISDSSIEGWDDNGKWNVYKMQSGDYFTYEIGTFFPDFKLDDTGLSYSYEDNCFTFDSSLTETDKARIWVDWIKGAVYIDNDSEFNRYLCYIDNGTDFELYIPYIDNGTNWEPL